MAGHKLTQRVAALEHAESDIGAVTRWHWVLQELGESSVDALSRYEAEHGSVGASEGIIRCKMAEAPCHA